MADNQNNSQDNMPEKKTTPQASNLPVPSLALAAKTESGDGAQKAPGSGGEGSSPPAGAIPINLALPEQKAPHGYIFYLNVGLLITFLMVAGMAIWSLLAPIDGAVVSSGVMVVESKPKEVQHAVGGIVGNIQVDNGDAVKAGDVLISLDAAQALATQTVNLSNYLETYVLEQRLIAERDDLDRLELTYPSWIEVSYPEWAKLVSVQQAAFNTRREQQKSQLERIDQQRLQARDQIKGLDALLSSRRKLLTITEEELSKANYLLEQGVIGNEKVINLRRDVASLEGDIGNQVADIARVESTIIELEIQSIQLKRDFIERVLSDLQQASSNVRQYAEELALAQKRLNEIDIKAPVDGIVHGLKVFTIGGVIPAGESIMQIIPTGDDLVIEARVEPHSVDNVFVSQSAFVKLSAFASRDVPELEAKVINRSADRFFDANSGFSYFIVTLKLLPGESAHLGDNVILPGMPADVFIRTGERSAISYLIKPLLDVISHAFREE